MTKEAIAKVIPPRGIETGARLLLRIDEGAEMCGVSRSKMYELVAAGIIPSVALGRSRRIPAQALARWVEENTRQNVA